ncbi:MAG: phosphoribosylglycinamide formyltransferase [Endomicrobium sp.]|jgi:phosphoribosylglycinamide formyltransferase-1|nr:phosphoribosylglycinamide formyltransferase [Endomicrobium sp.]
MMRIAVLVSGEGSNMQSIIDSTKNGNLKGIAQVVLVISNNSNAYALRRAENENIKFVCIEERKNFGNEKSFNGAILEELEKAKTNIVCLAGYMKMIGHVIIEAYHNRILNIHPALLPKFGGKGMYGHYVHEAVVKAKETESGATVHFVEKEYDNGEIIIQQKIEVFKNDSPEDVAKKVLVIEHQIYPEAIKKIIENKM